MTTLDADRLNQLGASIGTENIPAILALVLETTPLIRDELQAAIAAGDLPKIARTAHKLKSDCANLGATGPFAELARLEALAKDNQAAGISGAATGLLSLIDRFLDDVRSELQRRSG
jgi:HPt (histidine-containing phosphotransfer) domain-containing protein